MATPRGSDSPVSADWSSAEIPPITAPSSGTRSPGRTTIALPTATVSAGTVRPSSSVAVSGRMSISFATASRVRSFAAS